jgi:hypothetical protein
MNPEPVQYEAIFGKHLSQKLRHYVQKVVILS